MNESPSISAIIIAKNEEDMIANCIETLNWCSEIILLDNNSIDATAQIAKNMGARVIESDEADFAKIRTKALLQAKTDWVFYIDTDERVTPELAREIMVNIEVGDVEVLRIKRENVLYGKHFNWGGWQDDWKERVFKRRALSAWKGSIHETPLYKGTVKELHHQLIHLTHRSTQDNLIKSADWTKREAVLLYNSGIDKVTLFTLFRKTVMEIFRRAILRKGRKDGMEGWLESIVQGMNRFLVYIQVWELQQKPQISEKYQEIEKKIASRWSKSK